MIICVNELTESFAELTEFAAEVSSLFRNSTPTMGIVGKGEFARGICKNAWFYQSAPKERRRGRAEKRLSKRVFLESPFLLCYLKGSGPFRCFKRKP